MKSKLYNVNETLYSKIPIPECYFFSLAKRSIITKGKFSYVRLTVWFLAPNNNTNKNGGKC